MGDVVKFGPWGGQGGKAWQWDNPIQKIIVKYGDVVDSVTFGYIKNEATVWSERFGGEGGKPSQEISIKEPEEYLITISCTTGQFLNNKNIVTSITFITNKGNYGPYGKATGNVFSIPVQGGQVVGLYGRYGWYLDAIGFNLAPLGLPKPISPISPDNGLEGVMKIGPWGGQGGKAWEWDQPVQKILVKYGDVVDSVTFGYIKNGATIWSEKFGGDGGKPSEEIAIKEPEEYLVTINGTTGSVGNNKNIVTSLAFISNNRSYGPYGKATGNQFSIPVQGGKIVGFFGQSGSYLDAIGFNMVPLGYPQPIPPVSQHSEVVLIYIPVLCSYISLNSNTPSIQ